MILVGLRVILGIPLRLRPLPYFSTYDLQSKPMKMNLSTQIISCLNITVAITIAITSLTIAIAIVYFAGSYLGYPFAQFNLRFTQPTQFQYQNTGSIQHKDTDGNFKEHEVARRLGVMLALSLYFFALMLELVFEGQRDVKGEGSEWNPWRMEALLFRVCFEDLLTLAILRGIR